MKRALILILLLPLLVAAQNVRQVELDDMNGDTFVFADNLDHDATIITFWATWCLPCQKEQPALQKIKEKHSDKDIQIVAISLDSPRSLAKVKRYVRSHRQYDFVFLLDPNGEVSRGLLVNEIPYSMIVDKTGKIVYTHSGYRKGDEVQMEQELIKLWKTQK